MGLSVRTNTSSLNSCRNLKKNSKKNASSLEKLASGYMINRAGDDASGLAISEKMKAQIKALDTASTNCENGINLVNTIDGYTNEIQDMIVRMVELATKSANGILEDVVDRSALQEEMDHLGAEIDRIAETANFNGNKILNGGNVEVTEIKEKIKVTSYVPYSDYIKDVNSLGANQLINDGDEYATVEFLAKTARSYVQKNGGNEEALNGKAIYYTEDGKNSYIAAKNAAAADIRAALGIGASDNYMTAETNEFGLVDSYSVSGGAGTFIDGDSAKTADLVKGAIDTYLRNNGNDLNSLKGAKVYYVGGNSAKAIVGASNMSSADISNQLNNSASYGTFNISVGYKSYDQYMLAKDSEITRKEEKNIPISLQIGETSNKADKLNVSIYDFRTDKLFDSKPVSVLQEVVSKPKLTTQQGSGAAFSVYGNTSGSSSKTYAGTGDRDIVTTETTMIYMYTTSNALKYNDKSTYENAYVPDISTQENARQNIDYLKTVTNNISLIRANYGALQNRLEYTVNNLDTTEENISAANSRIRDTDMAKEMMAYTQTNVLTQAAQAMLAQANTQPQNVLSLLQ